MPLPIAPPLVVLLPIVPLPIVLFPMSPPVLLEAVLFDMSPPMLLLLATELASVLPPAVALSVLLEASDDDVSSVEEVLVVEFSV